MNDTRLAYLSLFIDGTPDVVSLDEIPTGGLIVRHAVLALHVDKASPETLLRLASAFRDAATIVADRQQTVKAVAA
ncbi:hypothetical protein [Streptomyces sp. NPDC058254]|uniref:hypothetical protein n=1 Tax=Streptomyces sp. NPDC058254 TaxID=3346406 RepID=UPI0036EE0987